MSLSRRSFLLSTPLSLFLTSSTLTSPSGSMHSELSELASKIPGAGMPDVYYPPFFTGDWLVSRELYAVDRPPNTQLDSPYHSALSPQAITLAREHIGLRQSYVNRFVPYRGHIVEDRLANERAAALAQWPGQRVDVSWHLDNPNVLSLRHASVPGVTMTREVKVTKRSFVDGPQGYGTFVASEYARVVELEGEGALIGFGRPPSIYGRRRIVRYRVSSVTDAMEPDGMDRITVEYLYPPSPPDAKAVVVLKYRDFLNRKREGLSLLS